MHEKLKNSPAHLEAEALLGYWEHPEGVEIPVDELKFLWVPDEAHHLMAASVAKQAVDYQAELLNSGEQPITAAVMVLMGATYPGSLIYDHFHAYEYMQGIEFTTIGAQFYKGPGEPLDNPVIQQDVPIDITDLTVMLVEDLGDSGRSIAFLRRHLLEEKKARKVVPVMIYNKPPAIELFGNSKVIYHCTVPEDTWIITPREAVETMVKRVPYWLEQGASMDDCFEWLVNRIGYPEWMVHSYLPGIIAQYSRVLI